MAILTFVADKLQRVWCLGKRALFVCNIVRLTSQQWYCCEEHLLVKMLHATQLLLSYGAPSSVLLDVNVVLTLFLNGRYSMYV